MKWRFTTVCFCLLLTHAMARTSSAQNHLGSSAWQATVRLDSATLYAGASVSSRVVTVLRRGDAVVINLEITSEDGKWFAVTAGGEPAASGYLSGRSLDVEEPRPVARWEYQPPPDTPSRTAGDRVGVERKDRKRHKKFLHFEIRAHAACECLRPDAAAQPPGFRSPQWR